MRISHFFIDRPIFATVLSLIITIVGLIAQRSLPIAEYPEIAPPTVNITATYPGASAQVIADTVAAPIEQEVNGVDDMLYIISQSTGDGRLSINVVFKPGTNIDQAQVLVQNRVAVAEPRLPEDVRRLGLSVRKASPDLMMVVHMTSPDGSRTSSIFPTTLRSTSRTCSRASMASATSKSSALAIIRCASGSTRPGFRRRG